jgi:hypothetical protein
VFDACRTAYTGREVQGDAMSFRSALRKFKPGNTAHIRHSWRAYVVIVLMGLVGLVLMLMLRGSH